MQMANQKDTFVTIDVETANADMASICQIGLAKYSDGILIDEWSSLVDPEDYFDHINMSIHGITDKHVRNSPTLPELANVLSDFMSGLICVSHTHFDRISIYRAFEKYSLTQLELTWLDSAKIARRTWDECAWSGYGLAKVCQLIGYDFKHHDALEDAKAAGQIVIAAINKSGLTIDDWLSRVNQPIIPGTSSSAHITLEGNPEGPLFGSVIVFTGSLQIPRREAASLAANLGCKVDSGVTKKTTLLVVGDQDVSKFGGKDKSSKHLKAEQLIQQGCSIRILKESDFKELVSQSQNIHE